MLVLATLQTCLDSSQRPKEHATCLAAYMHVHVSAVGTTARLQQVVDSS